MLFGKSGATPREPLLIVTLITLLGAAFRINHLGYKSLWFDEASLHFVSRGGLGDVITQNAEQHSAPPLNALLVNLATGANDAEFNMRIVAVLAGILAVPVIYRLLREFLPRPVSYFMTLLVALAPMQIHHAQDAREYALTFLLAGLMFIFFMRFLRRGDVGMLGIVMIVSIFTQYGLALLILGLNLIVALNWGRLSRSQVMAWAGIQVVVLIAVALVYQIALYEQWRAEDLGREGFLKTSYWAGTPGSLLRMLLVNNYALILYAFPGYDFNYLPPYFPDGFIFVTVVAAGVFALFKPANRLARLLIVVPPLVIFAAALLRVYPYHGVRHTIFLNPLIYLAAGYGILHLTRATQGHPRRRAVLNLCLAILLGMGLVYSFKQVTTFQREEAGPVVSEWLARRAPGEPIFVYYDARHTFRYYVRGADVQVVQGRQGLDAQEQQIDELLAGPEPVWLFFSHCGDFIEPEMTACSLLVEYTAAQRSLELVATALDAWLYRAAPTETP